MSDFIIENTILKKYTGEDEEVTVPEGISEIGISAFAGRSKVRHIIIPEGVMVIGYGVFAGCTGLESLELPESVREVTEDVFKACPAYIYAPSVPLSSVKNENLRRQFVMGFINKYGTEAKMTDKAKASYRNYIKGRRKKFYKDIYENKNLLRFMLDNEIIPKTEIDSVIDKAEKADAETRAMLLEYRKNILPDSEREKMENEELAAAVTGVYTVSQADREWKYEKIDGGIRITGYNGESEDVTVPVFIGCGKVTEIDRGTFSPNASRMPPEVKKVRENIRSVILPEGLAKIEKYSFRQKEKLEHITIPEGIGSIEGHAFESCRSLHKIIIPESVINIDSTAFDGCAEDFVICGAEGSCAEKYADENNINFETI